MQPLASKIKHLSCSMALSAAVAAVLALGANNHAAHAATAAAADAAASGKSDYVSVFSYNGERMESMVEVPLNPKRVAVIDYATLDIIDNLGADEAVVGTSKGVAPAYLQSYMDNKSIVNLGTVKEVDLEALMALEPEIIFIGGRLASQYDKLSQIAPVVFLAVDYKKPLMDSVKRSSNAIATIFGKEHVADEMIASFEERIAKVKEKAANHTTVVGMVNASQFRTLGDSGRCSFIGRDLGFTNLAKDLAATHGNEASFELLLQLNPDFIFILDRDSAIGRAGKQGAQLARDLMDNELVHKTKAHQDGHIHYLNSSTWYLSEGGLTATDLMLQDIEEALDLAEPQD